MSKDEQIEQLVKKNSSLSSENQNLKWELSQLKKLIYGTKSERQISTESNDQLNLFIEEEPTTEQPEEAKESITYDRKKSKQKHPGRHVLPSHLPVEEIVIEPDQDITGLTKISEEVTDTLEYTPASLVIKRTIRPKYAKSNGQGVLIADLPHRALPKSIAESSLLSYILVSKFVDHLPFYRQIQRFVRDYKWKLSSSTINDWFIQVCTLLEPLYQLILTKILECGYMQADESPIKVLDKDKKGKTHQGYQWVYYSPEEKLVLFNYRKGRSMQGPKEMLSGYKGVLQCDGYAVYDNIGKSEGITLAGCLVHVRRKFVEAQDSDATRANHVLGIFSKIYKLEKEANKSGDRQKCRIEQIFPKLVELKSWIQEEGIKVLPKSPIGKAMTYMLNQWDKIEAIFTDERIELDNNLIENKIRPLALGRKNYLFAGSHAAGQRIAMMYTFMGSCKANNVNPYEWLKYVLDNISETSIQNLEQFLPNNYKM